MQKGGAVAPPCTAMGQRSDEELRTVGADRRAVDEARIVGGEKRHAAGDFLGLAQTTAGMPAMIDSRTFSGTAMTISVAI